MEQITNLKKARTCDYVIQYRVVWTTKNRAKVIDKEMEAYLETCFINIAAEKDFIVLQTKISEQSDISVIVTAHPKIAPSYMVKMLKGISGRRLFLKYPNIKNDLGQFWNSTFYLETMGSTSNENIQDYLARQE